ncbi:MAG TPA: HAMP domain-containing sensor histidine kinase, partial [Gaiella sp.]|nr:HAMP domain-containing sensor histidine kinase [Gaiella sp.]
PVAALEALAAAAPTAPAAERARLVALAVAAGRDVERLVTDPQLVSLRPEAVDLGALARGLASERVVVTIAGSPRANVDPTRIRQALANLVENGLRHGTTVAIDVGARDGRVVVDVADDGPGLDEGLDPFARGTSGARSTGIGLWLARAIAEAHDGSLDPVGAGPGARFRLVLPSASGEG